MKLNKKLQAEILKIYNTYWDAYLAGDMKTFASMLDDNIKVFGTAVSEVFNNKTETVRFYKATADQMTGKAEFRNRKIKMNPVDETVLIHEQSDLFVLIENEWIFYSPVRVSAIFVNTPKGWRLTHQHGSFPDSRAEAGEQIAPEKIKKENLELREAIKRRTIELENKNRELEIEASLEKVRTIAMGMRKPDDMLDVCKTISLQLHSLDVKEIRNVQTAIIYESKSIYINYEYYAKHKKQFITEVDFKSHYYQKLFVNKMLKGTGEIFTKTIKGKKVKEWYEHQKTTNQFADRYLGKAKSLSYYWFSLGPLALGISTYSPLSEEQLNLFIRFRNVFELAYQRYLDIEQAIAQAREAQIEASLERVRAVAMSMSKSDDLISICEVSFKEFKKLGFDNIRNALIHIQYDEQKYFMDYDYSDLTGGALTKIEYGSHPVVEDYLKQIRSAEDAFYQGVIKEDQLEECKDFRRNSGQIDDPRLDKATALYYYFFSIGIGDTGISTLEPIKESQIKILKRFRNVFDLAYRRYTDITRAEAQAREAKIEAALEKIRSRALAMRNSSEVENVSTLLFSELEKMDINPNGFSIMIFDEEKDKYELWRAREVAYQGAYETFSIKAMYDKFDKYVSGFSEELKSAWTKGNPFFVGEFSGEKRVPFLQANREMANYSDEVFEKMKEGWPDSTFWHLVFFKYGWFGVLQNEQLIKEDLLLIHRFAEVFDFAYTRFLDLQKAEAQAREARIEAALERVRSRSMGMQKSEELKNVIQVVYEQFVHLKINVDHAGFVVDYKPKGDWHFWIADEQDIPSKITHPYFESVWANQFNEAKENGADFFATNLNFEEKNKFYKKLLSYVSGLPDASKDFYLSCPGLAISTVLLENVSLYIENFSGIPYTGEENN
jgi:ketosteroid isomerase-like protein